MLVYPDIDPVMLRLGALELRWYGLAYVAALLGGWWLLRRRWQEHLRWPSELWADLLFYTTLGVLIGGRLGFMLFYQGAYFWREPLMLLRIWEGGMSLHGGVLGVAAALWWLARSRGVSILRLADLVAQVAPLGLLLGRLANFINGELWGRPTELPWGMVFPHVDELARHPSQLYEAALEGGLLFVFLYAYARRRPPPGRVAGWFLLGYALLRGLAEEWREPDAHIGLIGTWTLGQILCLPMAAGGVLLLYLTMRTPRLPREPAAHGA